MTWWQDHDHASPPRAILCPQPTQRPRSRSKTSARRDNGPRLLDARGLLRLVAAHEVVAQRASLLGGPFDLSIVQVRRRHVAELRRLPDAIGHARGGERVVRRIVSAVEA